MYDELIKNLRICSGPDCKGCTQKSDDDTFCSNKLLHQAADAIEELIVERDAYCKAMTNEHNTAARLMWEHQRLYEQHCWIPVTERLPECDLGAEVGNIEWISYERVYAGCFGRGGKYRDAYFRTWTDAGEGIDAKEADYWRAVTLPEPPKEET